MSKYAMKPVIVEAFQMTEERRHDNSEWPQWLHEAWNKERHVRGSLHPFNRPGGIVYGIDNLEIKTVDGVHLVNHGDFIIQFANGDLFSSKPDIFEATYDLVD